MISRSTADASSPVRQHQVRLDRVVLHHNGPSDLGQRGEHVLDLRQVHLEAADGDLGVPAAEDLHEPGLRIDAAGVPGVQPAIRPAVRVLVAEVWRGRQRNVQFTSSRTR